MLGKILGVATVGSSLASLGAMRRFLSSLMMAMILAVVSGFMLCILLAIVLYLIYFCWVRAGGDPVFVGLILGTLVLLATAVCLGFTLSQFRKLKDLSSRWFDKSESRWPDLSVVLDAFLDGFLNHKDKNM